MVLQATGASTTASTVPAPLLSYARATGMSGTDVGALAVPGGKSKGTFWQSGPMVDNVLLDVDLGTKFSLQRIELYGPLPCMLLLPPTHASRLPLPFVAPPAHALSRICCLCCRYLLSGYLLSVFAAYLLSAKGTAGGATLRLVLTPLTVRSFRTFSTSSTFSHSPHSQTTRVTFLTVSEPCSSHTLSHTLHVATTPHPPSSHALHTLRHWRSNFSPRRYTVEVSEEGRQWFLVYRFQPSPQILNPRFFRPDPTFCIRFQRGPKFRTHCVHTTPRFYA